MSFSVGDIVDVPPRQRSGINTEGGAARVTRVDVDEDTGAPTSVSVAYIVGVESERGLPVQVGAFAQSEEATKEREAGVFQVCCGDVAAKCERSADKRAHTLIYRDYSSVTISFVFTLCLCGCPSDSTQMVRVSWLMADFYDLRHEVDGRVFFRKEGSMHREVCGTKPSPACTGKV